MPRRKKAPKPRAPKTPKFLVEPWQPLLDFLNGALDAPYLPCLLSLEIPPHIVPVPTKIMGTVPRPHWGKGATLAVTREEAQRLGDHKALGQISEIERRLSARLAPMRESLRSAVDEMMDNPKLVFTTEAGQILQVMTFKASDSARLVSPWCTLDGLLQKRFWLQVRHYGDAAVLLLTYLWLSGENWRLKRCRYCIRYFLKRTKRPQEFCSDGCRYNWHNYMED